MLIKDMPDQKILVFGATGNTGKSIVERGIKEGYQITAFVRTPSKLSENVRNNVKVVKGDVLKREQVEDAIEGHDFILSALGTGWSTGPTTLLAEASHNIVSGMKKHGVKRIAVVGVESLIPGHWKPGMLKHVIDDHQKQVDVLNAEKDSIDWVAVMPPQLWRSDHVGSSYWVEKDKHTGRMYVTTGEIADFMFKCIKNDNTCQEYKHRLVGISSGPPLFTTNRMIILAAVSITAVAYYLGYLNIF